MLTHLTRLLAVSLAGAAFQLSACNEVTFEKVDESAQAATTSVSLSPATDPFVFLSGLKHTDGLPELPRVYLRTDMPAVTGRSLRVRVGEDLQAALDGARPGDEIVLDAGATYTGTLTLPRKAGQGWIIIRSDGSLPSEGTRITPADQPQLAKLRSQEPGVSVINTEPGANHYRLVGLEITAFEGSTKAGSLVSLGSGGRSQSTLESQPYHLVLDRVYIHGAPNLNLQRCIALNSASTAIIDSWLSECHGKGFDSQAIVGWNGTGPYKIVNNHLGGAGENVMFGGADPKIPGALPRDIEIGRNHFIKPPDWEGIWTAKNLLELKIGQRVLIEGNVFENSWRDGQIGFALNIKTVNQNGGAPWSETSDITFRYNIVRNTAHGVSIGANPGKHRGVPAARMLFEHNAFDRIGTGDYPGGRLFQASGIDDLIISHNTAISSHSFLILAGGTFERLNISDNIFAGTKYGLTANGSGYGIGALNARSASWTFKGNVVAGMDVKRQYPEGNSFPAAINLAGTLSSLDLASRSARQGPSGRQRTPRSPSRAGADIQMIETKTSGVVIDGASPRPTGLPPTDGPAEEIRFEND